MLENLFFSVAVNSSSGVILFTRKNNFYCSFVISLFPLEPQWVSQGKRYLALLHYMSLRAFSNLFLNHRHSHGNIWKAVPLLAIVILNMNSFFLQGKNVAT